MHQHMSGSLSKPDQQLDSLQKSISPFSTSDSFGDPPLAPLLKSIFFDVDPCNSQLRNWRIWSRFQSSSWKKVSNIFWKSRMRWN